MSCRPGAQELKKKKRKSNFRLLFVQTVCSSEKNTFFFFFAVTVVLAGIYHHIYFLQTAVHPSWVWSNLLICIICLRSLDSLSLMMPQSRDWPDWHCHIYSGNNRQPYHFIGPEKLIYNIIFSLCVSSSLSCSSVDQDCL